MRTFQNSKYTSLLKSRTADKWQRIGIQRRSGIAVPLFSIYSKSSIGIGEIPDLKLLIDWCKKTGFSIIQLLPLYDTGDDYVPYNAISSFALDYMYLRIQDLKDIDLNSFDKEIKPLKTKFPVSSKIVDYNIKKAKHDLLWKIFRSKKNIINESIIDFANENKYWLKDYSLFKILSEINNTPNWELWDEKEKSHGKNIIKTLSKKYSDKINFHIWLQWQLNEQIKEVKKYANERGILIMGDMPFLVSRYSADVWSHQNYFKLNLAAGAPPDMFFSYGQRWGMPPYNWKSIKNDGYEYLKQKLKYAENFFDMYRIDHFIGLFRLWTIDCDSPVDEGALYGKFDPEDENKWEKQGSKILDVMTKSTDMLPCAEDLGTVPKCSYNATRKFGIPGIEFQRYTKKKYKFVNPKNYRINSSTVISTHDSTFFINWWDFEAGSLDKNLIELLFSKYDIKKKDTLTYRNILFNINISNDGRLFWKKTVNKKVIHQLFNQLPELKDKMLELYHDSFDERNQVLKFLVSKNDRRINKVELMKKCLLNAGDSSSIFNIQLLQEYLCLDPSLLKKINNRKYRINKPGTTDKLNWSLKLPISLEKFSKLKINRLVLKLNKISQRN